MKETIVNQVSYFDEIKYGNIPYNLMQLAKKDSPIKDWFLQNPDIFQQLIDSAPANSSETTKKELEFLVGVTQNIDSAELDFASICEEDHIGVWYKFLNKIGVKTSRAEVEKITDMLDPLTYHMKNLVNRPRPYQLAYYLGIQLYPRIQSDANTSAYPGGHALDSYVIAEYYSRKTQSFRISQSLHLFANRVAYTRIQTGLHYPSDDGVSKLITKYIFDNNLFKI
jgi:hypothetical protein